MSGGGPWMLRMKELQVERAWITARRRAASFVQTNGIFSLGLFVTASITAG
jgi:hypothetical protein